MTGLMKQKISCDVSINLERVQDDHWSEDGEPVTKEDLAGWHLQAKVSLIEYLSLPDVVVTMKNNDDNVMLIEVKELINDDMILY